MLTKHISFTYKYVEGRRLAMDFDTVIEKIGGGVQLRVSEILDVHPATLSGWKRRNQIPKWRQDQIRRVAREMGVEIPETKNKAA
jgi:hypothetical protein